MHIVPPLATLLIQYPALKVESFSRLHTMLCGAAPLGLASCTKLLERIQNPTMSIQEGDCI